MNKYFLIFIFSSILFGCSEPIPIDVEETEKKIVVNSIITPDSLIKVNLTKSIGILEVDNNVKFIENAEIKLFEDDVFIENLTFDTLGYYYSSIYPKVNKTYKITATNNELEDVESFTVIPENVVISDIIYDLNYYSYVTEWWDEVNQVLFDTTIYTLESLTANITFKDTPGVNNYYMLAFYAYIPYYIYPPPNYEPVYMGDQLTRIEYSSNTLNYANYFYMNELTGYVISDELFQGINYTFSVDVYIYSLYKPDGTYVDKIYANLISVSEDFYNYVISRNKYSSANGNPLAEPVNVFSNVTNGFGLFTSYSSSRDSIELKVQKF